MITWMASVPFRRPDEAVKAKLQAREAIPDRSAPTLEPLPLTVQPNLAEVMRSYVAQFGGVTLNLPKREIVVPD